MKLFIILISTLSLSLWLAGCAHQTQSLGSHVANLRAEQTYNPNATQDNLGVVPSGSGERMEGAYQVYTGKQSSELKGNDSQFLEGFSN